MILRLIIGNISLTQWIQNNLPNPQQYNIVIPYNYAELPQTTLQPTFSIEFINPKMEIILPAALSMLY